MPANLLRLERVKLQHLRINIHIILIEINYVFGLCKPKNVIESIYSRNNWYRARSYFEIYANKYALNTKSTKTSLGFIV